MTARAQPFRVPAPLGGLNALTDPTSVPDGDATDILNMLPGVSGLRTRPGTQLWSEGVTDRSNDKPRHIMQYKAASSSNDKLFCTVASAIFDITTSAASYSPSRLLPSSGTSKSGFGVSLSLDVGGTKYLLYCDEEYGLYVYNGTTWFRSNVGVGVTQEWEPSTDYVVGNTVTNDSGKTYYCNVAGTSGPSGGPTGTTTYPPGIVDGTVTWGYNGEQVTTWQPITPYAFDGRVKNGGNYYVCRTAGTSGAVTGPTGTGQSIVDGTCVWDYISASPSIFGPSLASQNAGLQPDPSKFVHACVWKNRLFFVERDTCRVWYTEVNQLYGNLTHFDFGPRARVGGSLVALAAWSYDAGGGLDSLLCAFTVGGDCVVYAGTDPDHLDTFGLKGCWYVGALTGGRRVVTDHGGELLVLSRLGVVRMSSLLSGRDEQSLVSSVSAKAAGLIEPRLQTIASSTVYASALVVSPGDNALMVLVSSTTNQLDAGVDLFVMSLTNNAWARWRYIVTVTCYAVVGNDVYLGVKDGYVHKVTGALDSVARAGTGGTSIPWSVTTPFRGSANWRRPLMARPSIVVAETTPLVEVAARTDLTATPTLPVASSSGTVVSTATAYSPMLGLNGCSRLLALEVGGRAKARTTYLGADVYVEEGGL